MKETLYKSLHVLMAFFVLASTVSWTVDKHICMGRVVSISVFEKAQGCDMPMESTKTCCENESFTVKGQEDLKLSLTEIDFEPVLFIATPQNDEITTAAIREGHAQLFLYDPPPLLENKLILQQRFLI